MNIDALSDHLPEWLTQLVRERIPGVVVDHTVTPLKCYYFLNGNAEKFKVIDEDGERVIRFSIKPVFSKRGTDIVRDLLDDLTPLSSKRQKLQCLAIDSEPDSDPSICFSVLLI